MKMTNLVMFILTLSFNTTLLYAAPKTEIDITNTINIQSGDVIDNLIRNGFNIYKISQKKIS